MKHPIPGDPVKGVAELGGVVERGEDASKAAATAAALAADWGPFWYIVKLQIVLFAIIL